MPLFVVTGNAALRAQLVAAARASRGHGSHFAIAPTVLDLLGYSQEAVATNYGASLLRNSARAPEFTTGDIFGLFTDKPRLAPGRSWPRLSGARRVSQATTAVRPHRTSGDAVKASEFGRKVAVDLQTDADFDEGRGCPGHDASFHLDYNEIESIDLVLPTFASRPCQRAKWAKNKLSVQT